MLPVQLFDRSQAAADDTPVATQPVARVYPALN
jgi:hypothetical protein